MLIELQNKKTISSEKIASLKFFNNEWIIKLTNGYEVNLIGEEFEWIMTIAGNLVKINDSLAVSIESIVMFEPNESGYMIGWDGEPPIQISQEKGLLLIEFLSDYKQRVVLSDRIQFLQEKNIEPEYNKL